MGRAVDRFPWLVHEPPAAAQRPGMFRRIVAGLMVVVQFWFPILAQAQVPEVPNYPERPIPVAPDYPRTAIPTTINYPAGATPTTTPNWQIDGSGKVVAAPAASTGVVPGVVVNTAKESQEAGVLANTIRQAQKPASNNANLQQMPSRFLGNETGVDGSGNVQINTRDIIPGASADSALLDSLNGDPSLINAAGKQIKANINQVGCRTTHFVQQLDPWGALANTSLVEINPLTVTMVPVPASSPVRYTRVDSASAEVWGQNIDVSFPTLGDNKTVRKVLRAATVAVPGFELEFKTYPFPVPADGTFFTYSPSVTGGLTGSFTTLGSASDKFTWKGSFIYTSGAAGFGGVLYAVTRVYSGTAIPPGGCPADPPGNPLDGVDYLQSWGTGIQTLLATPRTGLQDAVKNFNDSAFKPHPSRYDPDMTAVFNSSESLGDNSSPVYSELFSGCTFGNSAPGSTTSMVHQPDIYHCQNLRTKAFDPAGCDGDRVFNFALLNTTGPVEVLNTKVFQRTPWPRPAPTCLAGETLSGGWIDPMAATGTWLCTPPVLPAYTPSNPAWAFTDVAAPYTGPIADIVTVVGGGGTSTSAPSGTGLIFQQTYSPVLMTPTTVFPWNAHLVANNGSTTNALVTAGTPTDAWKLTFSGSVTASSSWSVLTDVYSVLLNQINFLQPGCEKYVAMMADGFCTSPSFTCQSDKNVGGVMDLGIGISPIPVDGSAPYGGIAKLLLPWGPTQTAVSNSVPGGPPYVPIADSCWKAHGGPMSCSFATGTIPCYTDAQGNQVCGSTESAGMISNFSDPAFIDNCNVKTGPPPDRIPLLSNAACTSVNGPKQVCAPSAVGYFSNSCYVYDVSYDCGTDKTLTNPVGSLPPTIQQCGSTPLRCLGTECHNPPTEASPDFAAAVGAASTVDAMKGDLQCADGSEFTVSPSGATPTGCEITVFPGKWMFCKEPIGRQIGLTPDCCADSADAAAGVDPSVYLKAIMVTYKISQIPVVQTALASMGETTGLIQSYETMSSALAGAAQSTMTSMTTAVTNIANEISWKMGEQAMGPFQEVVTQAMPSMTTELGGFVSAFQQQLWEGAYNVLADALGPELAGLFVSGSAQTTVVVGAEGAETTAVVGGFSAGPVLLWLGYAYLAYQILQIIGHIVFACEADELKMALEMKVGNCHSVGGYCKTKAFLVGCVEWRNSACCYKTPLSRIIQEQIRKQIDPADPTGGFGKADNPTCSGLTLAQLSAADWSLIDLSEWLRLLQDAGLVAPTAEKAETMYGLGVNTTETVLGITPPANPGPNYVNRTLTNLAPITDLSTTRRIDLAGQQVCYTDPSNLPWYQGNPVPPEAVIKPVGGSGGYGSCGEGCIELTLGSPVWHSYANTSVDAEYRIDVLRPDLLDSAYVVEGSWDDHIKIDIGGSVAYKSPSFDVGGELATTWCLTAASSGPTNVPSGWEWSKTCNWPPNVPSGGILAPGLDVLAQFSPGGVIQTHTYVKAIGQGHGFVRVRINYHQPPVADPAGDDCITPPPRETSPVTSGMSCAVLAMPSAASPGQTVTLQSACSPTATAHLWSATGGCSVPTGGAIATVSESAATTCTYTDNASTATLSATASATVTYAPTALACTMTASRVNPSLTMVTGLTLSCSGEVVTNYVWTGCTSTSASCIASATVPGPVTYSALVNGTVTATATVNWQAEATAADFCSSYSNVTEQIKAWNSATPILTSAGLPFAADQVRSIRFEAPGTPASYAIPGSWTVTESGGPAVERHVTLSRSRCDFRDPDPTGVNGPYAAAYGTTASVAFNVGAGLAKLPPGYPYYLAVRNWDPNTAAISCMAATCDAAFTPVWPH